MTYYSSHDTRTAGGINQIKSVQSWKTPKKTNTVETNIANALAASKVNESRTANHKFSLAETDDNKNKGNYSFKDVIDVINPLHHVPVVGTVYRKLTGDTLHPASRIIGGSIYGGPIGAISSTLSGISEMRSGQDVNEVALGFVTGNSAPTNHTYKVASHAYQPDPNERTARYKQQKPAYNNEAISYALKESYSVDPVTTLTFSPLA